MAAIVPFTPLENRSITIAVTSASAAAFTDLGSTLSLYNSGTTPVFVRWGSGAQTAVATDYAVAPGVTRVSVPSTTLLTVACIGTVGGSLYASIGEGGI